MDQPKDRERILIFDPFAGISGDMILGGLLDLGLSPDWLKHRVSSLGLNGVEIRTDRVRRGAFLTRSVTVRAPREQPERRLADVLEIIDRANLTDRVRGDARAAFERLATVEAELHGTTPQEVHFHEVGAVDAIVDIVAVTAGVRELDVAACHTRSVALGRGWVATAHGRLPLPAPATLKLLEGLPVHDSEFEGELTTPTGAVLLSVLTAGRRPPDTYTPLRSGFGAGSRNPDTHPNCLRLVLAETGPAASMYLIQTDIDDMPPEFLPSVVDDLREAGATDVWTYPVQMKKGRTGVRVEALVTLQAREPVQQRLLRESTSIGLRFWPVRREVLPRTVESIQWHGFTIRVKRSVTPDGHVRCKPEYDDILHAARRTGKPPLDVWRQVERQLEVGNC